MTYYYHHYEIISHKLNKILRLYRSVHVLYRFILKFNFTVLIECFYFSCDNFNAFKALSSIPGPRDKGIIIEETLNDHGCMYRKQSLPWGMCRQRGIFLAGKFNGTGYKFVSLWLTLI